MRIGIIAALPGELKPLVRGWQKLSVVRGSGIQMWQTMQGEDEVVAVCAGMGAAAARRAFTAAEFAGTLDMVLSVGWAGATKSNFVPGACFAFSEIIDTQTGERFHAPGGRFSLRLVTVPQVVDAKEKKRLWDSYQAGVVDMEAATVARLAQMRDVPFFCFKAISDSVEAELPDLNRFIDVLGQLKMPAFLAHIAARPQYWSALVEMGMNTSKAARALAKSVQAFLVHKSVSELVRLREVGG